MTRLPRLLGVLAALLSLGSCASDELVIRRDRFPLDPREELAGPFPDGVTKAWARLLAGDAAGAEAAFRAASSEASGMAADVGRVEALVLVGQPREASELCGALLEAGEATVALLVACGEARAREGDAVEGYGLYRRALARTSDRPGLAERAEQLRLAARDALSARARETTEEGLWDEARADIARALEFAPESAELLTQAGDIELEAGDSKIAFQRYREALVLDPKNSTLREKMGDLASQMGALDVAATLFDDLAREDPRFTSRAEEARLEFRVANWPDLERRAARSPRLTRAGAATLVWWMYPEVREAKVATGVIASDVVPRKDSRALTRALSLGLLEADRETHRASPDAPLTIAAGARLLLRLLGLVTSASQSLPCPRAGRRVPRSASESVQAAQACGLLEEPEGSTMSGPVFTRALDRIRALAESGKP
jgi:tetratricopeptide (TPR) repeat protein